MPGQSRRSASTQTQGSSPPAVEAGGASNADRAAAFAALQGASGPAQLAPVAVSVSDGLLSMLTGEPPAVEGSPPQARQDSYDVERHEGTVAVRGAGDAHAIDPNDVDQGMVGDCYLHAAMAAIARANPQSLADLIEDNGDGTYDVTLHFDVDGDWVPWAVDHVIRVDDSFPTRDDGLPAYAGDSGVRDGAELWVMLIEKAWAVAQGSYDAIWSGTNPDGLRLLGMEDVSNLRTSSKTAAELGTFMHEHLEANHALICQTPDYAGSSEATRTLAERVGTVGGHGYAVVAVDVGAGTVDLQNPWGTNSLAGVSLDDFKAVYTWITVGE